MLYQQITKNKRKTVILLAIFVIILAIIGAVSGKIFYNSPIEGIMWSIFASVVYLLIGLANPASMIMRMNHAIEIKEQDDPELWHVVEDMAMVAQVPMPRVFIIEDDSPNAFATGKNPQNSCIAVTMGLRKMLTREELEGVIGHEISHIKNYDILVSTVAIVLVAVISFIGNLTCNVFLYFGNIFSDKDDDRNANWGWLIYLFMRIFSSLLVFSATLVQFALSRNREYLADAGSVELTRNPKGLISALTKISTSEPMTAADKSSASLYFENPFHKHGLTHLFDTHPTTKKRIERLEKM